MADLVAHIKNITNETNEYRARVRDAESVISQLKTSGEASIEQLMEQMYAMKLRQEELDENLARSR